MNACISHSFNPLCRRSVNAVRRPSLADEALEDSPLVIDEEKHSVNNHNNNYIKQLKPPLLVRSDTLTLQI